MIKELCTPIREGKVMGHSVGKDKHGKVNTVYMNITQSGKPMILVAYNLDTRTVTTYRAPRDHGAWGSIAASDGCIYLGTYGTGTLYKFDPLKEEIEDLGTGIHEETFIWDFAEDDFGNIYGGTYGNGKLMKYNLKTGEKTDLGRFHDELPYCRRIYKHKSGKIVCSMGTSPVGIGIYDPVTDERKFVQFPDKEASSFIDIFHGEDEELYAKYNENYFLIDQDSFFPIEKKVTPKNSLTLEDGTKILQISSGYLLIEKSDGNREEIHFTYDSSGAELFMLEKGPDGRIYGSSALPLKMFYYDPKTGEYENLGNPTTVGGEIYSMAHLRGKLFTGAYPHSTISVYDPQLPWDFGTEPGKNPRQIQQFISHGQNRPLQMCVASDEKIYIATIPAYGQVSGSLCRLDPETHEYKVWRGIVGDNALQSVCAIPGEPYICAGTTFENGLGKWEGEQPDASLLLFDIEKEETIHCIEPVKGGSIIQDLHYYDGKIYGLVSGGHLFAYDYKKREVVYTKKLEVQLVIWPGLHITKAGCCYYGGDQKLYKLDLKTDETELVEDIPGWELGFLVDDDDNKFYCCVGATLFSIDL